MSGVALVTGGSRGLGRAAARALTGAGWRVAVTGRSAARLQEVVDSGEAALALPGDAASRADVQAAVSGVEDGLGPLELVVANAGRFEAGGRVWEGDPDDWWRDIEVNLRGPQLALWAALPAMVARGRGRVVVLGSGFGVAPTPGATGYSASKAAVLRLVDGVAAELAGTGVAVLAVSPGMVPTDMTHGFPAGFLGLRPDLADPPPQAWAREQDYVALLLRVAAGELDPLSGRLVRARDDVAAALAAAATSPEPGTLRLAPYPQPTSGGVIQAAVVGP